MNSGQDMIVLGRDRLLSTLRSLGLSAYEASTFYALVTEPGLTAADLCHETGIPDSKIYHTLSELERRGMIAVQKGRPNVFKAQRPEEAMANLKKALEEEHERRLGVADELTTQLSTLYGKVEGRQEMELAYIIRGLRGITSKMNDLILRAQRSLILFIPDTRIWKAVEAAVVNASDRKIKIDLALTENVERKPLLHKLGTVKELDCQCCILVADGRTLLSVTDWSLDRAVAILTQEPTMIRFTKEYYENPNCCKSLTQDSGNIA